MQDKRTSLSRRLGKERRRRQADPALRTGRGRALQRRVRSAIGAGRPAKCLAAPFPPAGPALRPPGGKCPPRRARDPGLPSGQGRIQFASRTRRRQSGRGQQKPLRSASGSGGVRGPDDRSRLLLERGASHCRVRPRQPGAAHRVVGLHVLQHVALASVRSIRRAAGHSCRVASVIDAPTNTADSGIRSIASRRMADRRIARPSRFFERRSRPARTGTPVIRECLHRPRSSSTARAALPSGSSLRRHAPALTAG